MRFYTILIVAFFIPVIAAAAPKCCDLSQKCIDDHKSITGDYHIGKDLTPQAIATCGDVTKGRAKWCVAKWTTGNWWCTSPGRFSAFVNGYSKGCPGGIFPTAGAKKPCFGSVAPTKSPTPTQTPTPTPTHPTPMDEECQVSLKQLQDTVKSLTMAITKLESALNDQDCELYK